MRAVLIFAVIALVAIGAGAYYVKVYQPAQELKSAQNEIKDWEARYQGVRDCLLGKSPGSAKTSEALAIREMAPDPWDRGKCTPLVSKLSRGLSNDTGIQTIETAWVDLDKAAKKAALAFATHVGSSTTLVDDPLPAALDALDAARIKLRETAKLSTAPHTGKTLVAAQLVPLADGNEPLTNLLVDVLPSAHGLVLYGKTDSRMVQLVLTAGGPPKVARLGPGTVRAVPDMSWGATPADKAVNAGAFDTEGVIATPTSLKTKGDALVAAAAGTLADGVLVFGTSTDLFVARAKGGTITADPPIKMVSARAVTDVDGRVALLWSTSSSRTRPPESAVPGTAHFGRVLTPGAEQPAVELPGEVVSQVCLTRDRVWAQDATTAFSFGGNRPLFRKDLSGARLQGCTNDAALFHHFDHPKQLAICTDDCRVASIPGGAPTYAATTVVGGKLVSIAAHNGVLGVWRELQPPVFYAMPESAQPVLAHEWPAMALTDGKVIDVIARGVKTFVLIRIPAA